MADLRGFDARNVEPSIPFESIPEGKYAAVITGSELKPTKAGTGSYLQLAIEIIEGPHRHRCLIARLNLDNPNPIAVEIAKAELSAICRAAGVPVPGDSAELHNIPISIHVRRKTDPLTGRVSNEIRGYSAKESPPDKPAASGNPPAVHDKPTSTADTPPWRRDKT